LNPQGDDIVLENENIWQVNELDSAFSREIYEVAEYLTEEKSFEPKFEFERSGGIKVYPIEDLRTQAERGSFYTSRGEIRHIKGECTKGLCKGELFIRKNELQFRTYVDVAQLGMDERDVNEALTQAFKEGELRFEYSYSSISEMRLRGVSAIPWESTHPNELNCWLEKPFSLGNVKEFVSKLEKTFKKIPIYYPPKYTIGRM